MLSISDVNQITYKTFIDTFGGIIEHCPLSAAMACSYRPFTDVDALQKIMVDNFLDGLSIPGKEGILRLHPDLAGRLAQSESLTSESTQEQAAAGLDKLSEDERVKMADLNTKYKTKFDFPFVICARQNKKEAILHGLDARLKNDRETEAVNGVNEVQKICRMRLLDLVDEKSFAKL